jgi:hypothetical protein
MIKYRPHRSTLSESMKLCKEFSSTKKMLEYVGKNSTICPESYQDNRIGWNNWHYVMRNGYVAGMCNIEEETK